MSDANLNISLNNMTIGDHLVEYYAIDRLGNSSSILTIRIAKTLAVKGINHNNRILTTKKYPNNYPTRQPPSIPFPNQPSDVSSILQDIKGIGLNAIRINMFWEGYRWYKANQQASTFLNRLKDIASTADSLGLGIIYNVVHQWKISSVIRATSTDRGAGFPEEVLLSVPLTTAPEWNTTATTVNLASPANPYTYDVPIDGTNNQTMTPRHIFWRAFINNYNVTIDNVEKPLWQHMWDDYIKDIVQITKDHRSTIGYELLNEPHEGVATDNTTTGITTYDYAKLANYYIFMGKKVMELTNNKKYIFFTRPLSWRLNDSQINTVYPDLQGKSGQYKTAELIKREMLSRFSQAGILSNIGFMFNIYGWDTTQGRVGYLHQNAITQMDEYNRVFQEVRQQNTTTNTSIPVLVGEWNQASNTITTEPTVDTYAYGYLQIFKERGYGWFYFNYDPNYPWTIKNWEYNDRMNNTVGMTYKQVLSSAINKVYIHSN